MTATLYPYILGSAWGRPQNSGSLQHHWSRLDNATWASDCGGAETEGTYQFHGVDYVGLLYDPEGDFCEKCLEIFLDSDYGKEFGIHPPYRPDQLEIADDI